LHVLNASSESDFDAVFAKLSQLRASGLVISAGTAIFVSQSGQLGGPHYSDLLPLWSEGKYFPLVYSREAVEKEVTDRLLLKP